MNCQSSYDAVAEEYARRMFDELLHKPLDRQLLARLANEVGSQGVICDLGCGPGQVARYLQEQGSLVCGVDLSPRMVECARQLTPAIPFYVADMQSLSVPSESWAGIAAFYSMIHILPDQIPATFRELLRVLKPGGWLLAAFHIGDRTFHLDEWWGHSVSVDFHFWNPDVLIGHMQTAGFEITERIERDPYPDVEYASRRCYIMARKSAG